MRDPLAPLVGKFESFGLSKPLSRVIAVSALLWAAGLGAMGISSAVLPVNTGGRNAGGEVTESHTGDAAVQPREDLTALRRVIDLYFESGDFAKALPFVDRAWALEQRDSAFLQRAVRIYLASGEYAKADAAAGEGLRGDSAALEFWRAAALSAFRLGRWEPGMALARRALRRFPDQIDLLTDLATMEVEMGAAHADYGKSLKRALAVHPGSKGALYLLGRKHALEGNFGEAETAFRAMVKTDSTHAKARAQLGIALYQQGKFAEAGECMIAALKINPRDYNSWYNLGEWYARKTAEESDPEAARKSRAQALQSYLHAVELNPDHAEAQFRIGVILHGNGEFKEAVRRFEETLRLDSTRAAAWFHLGVACQRLSLLDRARACVQRAFAIDPLNRLVIAKLRELS